MVTFRCLRLVSKPYAGTCKEPSTERGITVDSGSPDDLDQRLLCALQLDGRAPFSRLAQTLGVSEHTAARRYRRLRTLGLRIVARPNPVRLGQVRWLIRLHCAPDAAGSLARALARRPDTSWVTLSSGGTELYCALDARSADEGSALLLRKLPRAPHVVSASTHCMMRIFIGETSTWHATRFRTPAPAAASTDGTFGTPGTSGTPSSPGAPSTSPIRLDATDRALFAELGLDGRATLPALSKAAGRSPSSVQRRLDRLRDQGALGFFVDFDPQLLGHHMSAQLWLKVAPAHLRTVGETLATHPDIAFAAAVTGSANLVASGVFRTPADLYDYIDHHLGPLPGIQSIETTPTLCEIKRLVPPSS
ncbi:Lrp/AsnC family transcriptional regulator [Streptomyces sp. NPDC018045]|uniref:Lrp/AsnC family transcriptional regulator n=1 Tax=Streptomyces sp. NPDC018045 TaxID=3365037 RepID=UPI00379E5363